MYVSCVVRLLDTTYSNKHLKVNNQQRATNKIQEKKTTSNHQLVPNNQTQFTSN